MSLRKSPRMTVARLEANRRNAQKSTGPRTARGKAQSRLNSLRAGGRSHLVDGLYRALILAPPGTLEQSVAALVTPEMAAHPLFAEALHDFREFEKEELARAARLRRARRRSRGVPGPQPSADAGETPSVSLPERPSLAPERRAEAGSAGGWMTSAPTPDGLWLTRERWGERRSPLGRRPFAPTPQRARPDTLRVHVHSNVARPPHGERVSRKKSFEQSQNVIENKGPKNTKLRISYDVDENTAT